MYLAGNNIFVGWRPEPSQSRKISVDRDQGSWDSAGDETEGNLFLFNARLWTRKKTSLTHSKTSCIGIFPILSVSAAQAVKYWLNLRACYRTLNPLTYSRT